MDLTKIILRLNILFGLGPHKTVAQNLNLTEGFRNPGLEVWPCVFWCWLNGNMFETFITRDLVAMKSKWINREEIRESGTTIGSIFNFDHNLKVKIRKN